MSAAIDPLFQPITIRNLTLKNRLVMSPMTRSMSPDGALPDIAAEYYGRRADHDIGLIVTEGIGVDHPSAIGDSGTGSFDIPDLHGDKPLEDWKAVVDRVHQAGSAIFPQLWHHGVMRLDYTGREAHAPSIRPSGVWGPDTPGPFHLPQYLERAVKPTKPATEEEIADVIAGYARSARNAVSIGFDGVAIHGAHGYLPDAFLWHVTNRRTDRWGGPTLRDRASFAVELIKAVRSEIGDRPLMFRFSLWKLHNYDYSLTDDPKELEGALCAMADAGVDLFDASTRKFEVPPFAGSDLSLAGWAKKLTGKPCMAVGGVALSKDLQTSLMEGLSETSDNLPLVREKLASGEFDLIGVGRALLSNPDFGTRVRKGEALKPFSQEHAATLV